MLASPKAAHVLERFTVQWLDTDSFAVVPKDADAFADFTADVRAAMDRQMRSFMTPARSFQDLMTAPYEVNDPVLAQFYGDTSRSGLLTLGAVLATHAHPNGTSPIHRGKLVREQLLCQTLQPPPPGLNFQPPEVDPNSTTRERFAQHAEDPSCEVCHRLIDPIGFGFEHFDGVGRYRTEENGLSVDASGEIVATSATDGTFTGVDELSQSLASSTDAQACFSLQWFRYAYGLEEDQQTRCMADALAEQFAGREASIEELLVALTQTEHFRYRLGRSGDADPDDDGPSSTPTPPDSLPGGDPPDNGGDVLDVQIATDSQWPTGSCHTATVTNRGNEAIDWTITRTLPGQLTSVWGATATTNGNEATFAGVDHNNILEPAAATSFGYCVEF